MATLVTLQEAKDHLRLVWAAGDPREGDLQAKLDEAEAIIVDYLAAADVNTLVGVLPVTAAVKLQLGELWRFRGDDIETKVAARPADGYLTPTITALLQRLRPIPIA